MKMTRYAFLYLILVIGVISLALGCQSTATVEHVVMKKKEQPMEITVALWKLAENMSDKDPLLKQLEQKLNIKIKAVPITETDYVQQYQIWASSGNLPDVFAVDAVSTEYLDHWQKRGLIQSLPENLSAYPHLASYLSSPEFQYLKKDGKFYSIPRQTYDSIDYNLLDRVVAYRWDLAQQAGVTKEPETWEEFQSMLQAIVDADPEQKQIKGLTSVNNLLIGGLFWLYSSPAATSDGSGSDFKWIKEDGIYIPAVFSKHSVHSLKMIRNFYESGLIDPDLPATRGVMAYDRFAEGKTAAIISTGGGFSIDKHIYQDRWLKQYPNKKAFYDNVKILKPLKAIDGNRYHAVFKTFWSESYISSKVSEEKLDRILQLFNYMNSQEFIEMRRYGQENVDYYKHGDTIIKTDPHLNIEEKYKTFNAFAFLLNWDGMFQLDENYTGISEEGYRVQRELVDFSLKESSKQPYEAQLTYMSTPTKDKFSIFDNEDMIRVMLSKEPVEKIWQDIIDGYKDKGLDRMIEEVNAKAAAMGISD